MLRMWAKLLSTWYVLVTASGFLIGQTRRVVSGPQDVRRDAILCSPLPAPLFTGCRSMIARSSLTPPESRLKAEMLPSEEGISIGFVGCGTIAASIATGFATQNDIKFKSISVSKRSESRSNALQEAFPDLVTVYDDNQDVLDRSDIVFLCVLPQQTSSVLSGLIFDAKQHTLVSLAATSKLGSLAKDSGLDPEQVYKMICLPSVAKHEGMGLVLPKRNNTKLKSMFETLGGSVECETEEIMNAMMIPSCLMGSMYGILRNNRDWLVEKGVSVEDASYFTGKTYLGIIKDAERNCKDPTQFDALIAEQTPGGLNEQALGNLQQQGVFDAYDRSMDAILSRLEGKSDGFLSTELKD